MLTECSSTSLQVASWKLPKHRRKPPFWHVWCVHI